MLVLLQTFSAIVCRGCGDIPSVLPPWGMTGRMQNISRFIPHHFQLLNAEDTIPSLAWSNLNDMWYLLTELLLSVSLHCTTSVPAEFFSLMTAKDSLLCHFILCYILLLLSLITFPQISWENSLFGLICGDELVGRVGMPGAKYGLTHYRLPRWLCHPVCCSIWSFCLYLGIASVASVQCAKEGGASLWCACHKCRLDK